MGVLRLRLVATDVGTEERGTGRWGDVLSLLGSPSLALLSTNGLAVTGASSREPSGDASAGRWAIAGVGPPVRIVPRRKLDATGEGGGKTLTWR